VFTVAVTLMPVIGNHVGWLYVGSAVVLNTVLAVRCIQLYKNTDRPHAVGLYKFSMLYLALLFLMLAVDQRWLYAVL
jgi:heme o synthase